MINFKLYASLFYHYIDGIEACVENYHLLWLNWTENINKNVYFYCTTNDSNKISGDAIPGRLPW